MTRKAVRLLAVLLLSCAIAGATFSGYMQKWGFRHDDRLSLQGHFEGKADRPFAYRRLFVDIAAAIEPDASTGTLGKQTATIRNDGRFAIVYYLTFASILLLLWAGYQLLRDAGFASSLSYGASAAFVLLFPMLQAQGGYWYDFLESALFCLFLVAARQGSWAAMLFIAAIGTWNKESFLFFTLTAWPLVWDQRSGRTATLATTASAVLAAFVYQWQRIRFAEHDGAAAEFHLADQLHFFMHPRGLLRIDWTYGLPLPHVLGIAGLVALGGLGYAGWRHIPSPYRGQAIIAAALNLPLFLLFCAPGEARNLSMLFPLLLLLIAVAIRQGSAQDARSSTLHTGRASQPAIAA